MPNKPAGLFIPLLFDLIGTGMLLLGFYFYQQSTSFLATAEKTTGTVTEYVRSSSSSGSRRSASYFPIVTFRAPSGETIEFKSNVGGSSKPYPVGGPVPILFNPQNPHEAKIESWFSLWGGATICAGLGAFFMLIGMSILLVLLRRRRLESWLQTNGQRIRARVIGVEEQVQRRSSRRHRTGITVGRTTRTRLAFILVAQWQDPVRAKIHVFRSPPLPYDPQERFRGKEVEVLIDPNDPQRYMFGQEIFAVL